MGAAWVIVVAMAACGGRAPAPEAVPRRAIVPAERAAPATPSGEREAAPPAGIAALHVQCEDPAHCPEGVAMIVGPATEVGPDGQPNRCTGALIAPDRILTASHCLPPVARSRGASCRGTWIAFAAVGALAEEWIECAHVHVAEAVDDREVLRPDFAILELTRPVARTPLVIDRTPPAPHAIVEVVSVTPHPIYRTQHALGTRLCRVRTTEEARALFGDEAARVGWLSDCPTYAGNSGAPILDRDGHVRGILHGGSGPWPGIGVTTPPPPE